MIIVTLVIIMVILVIMGVVAANLAKVSYMIIYMIFDDHRVGDHGNDDDD